MEHKIIPLKQTTEFGCLATCYGMVNNYFFGEADYTQDKESKLTSEAFRSETEFNEHLYLNKLSKQGCDIKVIVETPYMVQGYDQLNTKLGCTIPIEYALIGLDDYKKYLENGYIIITLVDLWFLDMIIHYPHYVVISGFDNNNVQVIDPKYGKKVRFSHHRFQQTLDSVKERLGYSPVIFAIKKNNKS